MIRLQAQVPSIPASTKTPKGGKLCTGDTRNGYLNVCESFVGNGVITVKCVLRVLQRVMSAM